MVTFAQVVYLHGCAASPHQVKSEMIHAQLKKFVGMKGEI